MRDGVIVQSGKFDDLMSEPNSTLADMMNTIGVEDEDSEEEKDSDKAETTADGASSSSTSGNGAAARARARACMFFYPLFSPYSLVFFLNPLSSVF